MKYLDLTGLGEVWANIKSYISSKIPTKTSQLQNDSNYVTTSQLPSKTSQLTNDSDFTTNAKLTSKANDSDVVHKSGDETINGVKTFTSEIVNTSPHFRHIFGNYGTFWRQDGYDLYLLITNRGDQYGSWNNFRPLKVNLATGICNINGTAGGVAWANVSDRPTKVSQFTNDSGYLTSGNVVDRTSNQSIDGAKTFNYAILTNSGLYTKADIKLRTQNIDNIETTPTNQIGTSGIGFTNKDASAWLAYNRYFRTTVDGTAFLQLHCLPIKKSDGSSTIGGYINIYNTGFARVNDPLSIDPNTTWNNNNIVTSNWVRKYFSNSIGNTVRSINGVTADNNGNVNIQGVSNGIGEIIQGYYVPNGIVEKSGSVYFGTLAQPQVGATLSDFRDINITITDEFYPEAGKIYDYSQIFSTLYLHSYGSDSAAGSTFDCGSNPKVDKWFGGWIKVAGSNLVRKSGRYLCTSVSPYGYAVTLRYNLTMTCETYSYPGGSYPMYECKIVSKTVPQNQMTVTSKATFMRVG